MKKRILAIVLCLTLLCSVACENTLAEQVGQRSGETDGAVVTSAPVVVLENSFTFTSLLPSESFMEKYGFTEDTFGWLNVYMENDLIYGIVPVLEGELETKVGVVVFDANGNILSEEERIFLISNMRAVYCLEDGGAICIYDISVAPKICRTDAENTILYEGEVARDGNRFSIAVSEDSIALAHGISLYIYDNTLQLQNTYTCPVEIKDLYWGEDGFLYGQTIQHDMMKIDPASGNSRPVYSYMVGEYGKYLGGGEYDLYVLKGDGLYGVKADENGELTEKCEPVMLMDSGVNLIDTPYLWDLWILDDDSMVIKYVDETYNATANPYYFLKRTEPLPREVVTVGCCNAGSEIRSLVLQYNRMQSEKFVQLIDYGDPRQGEESLQEKIFENMENGTNPDLFIFTDQYESVYLNVSKQGYLADLAVFSEVLTASAAASVTRGTTMDRIPYYITYNTLITTTGKQDVTAENLAEEGENIQNGAFLFGGVKDAYKYLLKNMESLFVDPLTKNCHFEGEEFTDYLEVLKELNLLLKDQSYKDIFQSSSGVIAPDYIHNGQVQYFPYALNAYSALGELKIFGGDMELQICGYPGSIVVPVINKSFVLFQTADNPEGAMKFLEYVLSDTVQTSFWSVHFPVTSSAFEQLLRKEELHYRMLERTDGYVDIYLDPSTQVGNDVITVIYTEEDKALLRRIIENENCGRIADPTVQAIIEEEIVPYFTGDRDLAATSDILQSRVGIYLAE